MEPVVSTINRGTLIRVLEDTETGASYTIFPGSQMRNSGRFQWDDDIQEYILDLQERLQVWMSGPLKLFTEHVRDGQIFRGHPKYRNGKAWMDWVKMDFGGNTGVLPCHIWCFVDLEEMPIGANILIDEMHVERGIHALVESAEWAPDPEGSDEAEMISSLVTPCVKRAKDWYPGGKEIRERQFYLVDVEAIVCPVAAYPDIGHQDKARYLVVKPKDEWADKFTQWLREPYDKTILDDEQQAFDNYLADPSLGFDDYFRQELDSDEEEALQTHEWDPDEEDSIDDSKKSDSDEDE